VKAAQLAASRSPSGSAARRCRAISNGRGTPADSSAVATRRCACARSPVGRSARRVSLNRSCTNTNRPSARRETTPPLTASSRCPSTDGAGQPVTAASSPGSISNPSTAATASVPRQASDSPLRCSRTTSRMTSGSSASGGRPTSSSRPISWTNNGLPRVRAPTAARTAGSVRRPRRARNPASTSELDQPDRMIDALCGCRPTRVRSSAPDGRAANSLGRNAPTTTSARSRACATTLTSSDSESESKRCRSSSSNTTPVPVASASIPPNRSKATNRDSGSSDSGRSSPPSSGSLRASQEPPRVSASCSRGLSSAAGHSRTTCRHGQKAGAPPAEGARTDTTGQPRARASWPNSSSNLVFPIPGSPPTRPTAACPDRAAVSTPTSAASSPARPTNLPRPATAPPHPDTGRVSRVKHAAPRELGTRAIRPGRAGLSAPAGSR
jgi:hypothetical protein